MNCLVFFQFSILLYCQRGASTNSVGAISFVKRNAVFKSSILHTTKMRKPTYTFISELYKIDVEICQLLVYNGDCYY